MLVFTGITRSVKQPQYEAFLPPRVFGDFIGKFEDRMGVKCGRVSGGRAKEACKATYMASILFTVSSHAV